MHTRGPWIVQESDYKDTGYLIKPAGDYVIAITDKNFPEEEEKSNAYLIAAAPEMLNLLIQLANNMEIDEISHDYDGDPIEDYKKIKNIIVKANGEPEPDLRINTMMRRNKNYENL